MAIIREKNVVPIGQFDVPLLGTLRSSAIHKLTADSLYDSMNVFIREGKLRNRPGLQLLDNTTFNGPVLGGGMVVTPQDNKVIAITHITLYERGESDTTWNPTAFTGVVEPFTFDGRTPIDIAYMDTSGRGIVIIASQGMILKAWDTVLGTTSVITATDPDSASIPTARSVCIASRRLITLSNSYTIRWSKIFEYNFFTPDAIANVSQTTDAGICVRSLSNLSFVVYKERSIYRATAQAGDDDTTAFAFAEPIKVEGPAGIHAVVDVGGAHIYMTKNGRIGMYDGTRYPQWLADGLWLFLQNDIDPVFARNIFGMFDFRLHTVTFRYPRVGEYGYLNGMVIINLPMASNDSSNPKLPCSFLGYSWVPCTFGTEMRFGRQIDRSVLFGYADNSSKAFISNEEYNFDYNLRFPCAIQTGMVSIPSGLHGYVEVETFFERGNGYGQVKVYPVISDFLESKAGLTPDLSERVENLEFNPVRNYEGFPYTARFFGLKYVWDSSANVRYSGAVLYGRSIG